MSADITPSPTETKESLSILNPEDILPVKIERTENVPVKQGILESLEHGKTLEISEDDIVSLRITRSKFSANIHVPELMSFETKQIGPKLYQIKAQMHKTMQPSESVFLDFKTLKFLRENNIKLYKFTGELPEIFACGATACLYEFPQGLLKIKTIKYGDKLFYDWFGNVLYNAETLIQASKCTFINRVVGLVYFPNSKSKYERRWAILLEKVPNSTSLLNFIAKQPLSKQNTIVEQLWKSILEIGLCLYTHRISVDLGGRDNIIVDGKTGQVWFVDIEHMDRSEGQEPKDTFINDLRKYFEKMIKIPER